MTELLLPLAYLAPLAVVLLVYIYRWRSREAHCAAACPVEAIKLVFGTERRGIDIPYVKPTFETNVAGIYIAGELGGMGLIRKAAEQGKQAIDSVVKAGNSGA